MPQPSNFGYFQIAIRGEENHYPALIDVSSFLYDLNLLYEFSRIVIDPQYAQRTLSSFSGYRNSKRVHPEDRLELQSLRIESPFELITIVAAAPAAAMTLWVLAQALEKVVNFPLNREILKLQRDKLRKELQSTPDNEPQEMPESDERFREQLHIREVDGYFGRVEQRLHDSPVQVREIEVVYVRELPAKVRSSKDMKKR
jgi:hypothetical protein